MPTKCFGLIPYKLHAVFFFMSAIKVHSTITVRDHIRHVDNEANAPEHVQSIDWHGTSIL